MQVNSAANKVNDLYPGLLWITSIVIAPLIFVIKTGSTRMDDLHFYFVVFLIFGTLYSLPVLFICIVSFNILIKNLSSPLLIKALLNLICIIGVLLTFKIISDSDEFDLRLIYSASIILSSLLYRVRTKKENTDEFSSSTQCSTP
jgi:hypothetical protein